MGTGINHSWSASVLCLGPAGVAQTFHHMLYCVNNVICVWLRHTHTLCLHSSPVSGGIGDGMGEGSVGAAGGETWRRTPPLSSLSFLHRQTQTAGINISSVRRSAGRPGITQAVYCLALGKLFSMTLNLGPDNIHQDICFPFIKGSEKLMGLIRHFY